MPPKRFYWITSEKHSSGYVHEIPVFARLRERGIESTPLVWDRDPIPGLGAGEFVVVRTPWDYLEKYPRFLEWLDTLPEGRSYNSANVLRWNSEKNYLRELEDAGVPLVPTVWMRASSAAEVRDTVRDAFPSRRLIVKPVRSASSIDTYRVESNGEFPAERFVDRPAMIQPFLDEIETDGERSLIYFFGRFSHAIQKRPRPGDFRVQESFGGRFAPFHPSADEFRFGDRAIAGIRARFPDEPAPLYARVDYVLVAGSPRLMEAELLEPDLFFHHAPGSVDRFVDALTGIGG